MIVRGLAGLSRPSSARVRRRLSSEGLVCVGPLRAKQSSVTRTIRAWVWFLVTISRSSLSSRGRRVERLATPWLGRRLLLSTKRRARPALRSRRRRSGEPAQATPLFIPPLAVRAPPSWLADRRRTCWTSPREGRGLDWSSEGRGEGQCPLRGRCETKRSVRDMREPGNRLTRR